MPQVSPVRNVSSHGENSSSNASQAKIAPGIELQSRTGRIKMVNILIGTLLEAYVYLYYIIYNINVYFTS